MYLVYIYIDIDTQYTVYHTNQPCAMSTRKSIFQSFAATLHLFLPRTAGINFDEGNLQARGLNQGSPEARGFL